MPVVALIFAAAFSQVADARRWLKNDGAKSNYAGSALKSDDVETHGSLAQLQPDFSSMAKKKLNPLHMLSKVAHTVEARVEAVENSLEDYEDDEEMREARAAVHTVQQNLKDLKKDRRREKIGKEKHLSEKHGRALIDEDNTGADEDEPPTAGTDVIQPYNAAYAHAKYRNFHKIYDRHHSFFEDLKEDSERARKSQFALAIFLIGPFLIYWLVWSSLMKFSEGLRTVFVLVDEIIHSLKSMVFLGSLLLCSDCAIRFVDFHSHRWIQVDMEAVLSQCSVLCVGYSLVRILSACNRAAEVALLLSRSDDYQIRQEFMTKVSNPTNVEPLQETGQTQEQIIFRLVWTPFYLVTYGTITSGVVLMTFGFDMQWYVLVSVYILLTSFTSVVGAHTLGPDIYGGVVILFEKPFEVGDIISVEQSGGAGGCSAALATGFVERIGLRSTLIRRFDMRACTVPNSWLATKIVSNWKRPRKLIFLELGVSHRTPLNAVKMFAEQVRATINNHDGVDQQLYTKAVFRSLDTGFAFRIVCFNSQGTKKQFVQQDLIYRISQLARELDVIVTFKEQTISVEKQDILAHFKEENSDILGADLTGIVPAKKVLASEPKVAPHNYVLVRLEEASGIENLLSPEAMRLLGLNTQAYSLTEESNTIRVFGRVIHAPGTDIAQMKSTVHQILDPDCKNVRWLRTLAFGFDPDVPILKNAKVQLIAKGKRFWNSEKLLAEADIDLSEMAPNNCEVTQVSLKVVGVDGDDKPCRVPSSALDKAIVVGLRVFKAPNISFQEEREEFRPRTTRRRSRLASSAARNTMVLSDVQSFSASLRPLESEPLSGVSDDDKDNYRGSTI